MSYSKDNILELLRVQHALMAAGYYAYSLEKSLGGGHITIEAREYIPVHDEELMLSDASKIGKLEHFIDRKQEAMELRNKA